MPNRGVRYVPANCFYDNRHVIMVRSSIYESEGPRKGLLREERKGTVLEGGKDDGVYVGWVGVFCKGCRDLFCGPRPKENLQDVLDKEDQELRGRE